MRLSRLFPILLILLQSGLIAGHAHTHRDGRHTDTPHIHFCGLLDLFTPDHTGEEDGHDHDADAVDLSGVVASALPVSSDMACADVALIDTQGAIETVAVVSFPLGTPPSTAGPLRPLYLTHCTLTI